jgi:hypothetical protein
MTRSQFSPQPVATGVTVRFDTASDSDTPADVTTLTGVPLPASAATADPLTGALSPILGPDGVSTLYQKVLDYLGQASGDPVELTGVAPSEPSGGTSVAPTVHASMGTDAYTNAGSAVPYAGVFNETLGQAHSQSISSIVRLEAATPQDLGAAVWASAAIPDPDAGVLTLFGGTGLGVHYTTLRVTSLSDTRRAVFQVDGSALVPVPTTSSSGTLTFADTVNDGSGGDLSMDGGSLASTTGGDFLVELLVNIDLFYP